MARNTGSVCRFCRREGMKLYLKGTRCHLEKCAIEKRAYAPGQHGRRRRRVQGYGLQLREKQKVKRIYGVLETQFRNTYRKAARRKGVTGENLLQSLERRLDNVVFRIGYASSRSGARQLVNHGHITVNGKRVDVPSYLVGTGDVIAVKEKSRNNDLVRTALESAQARGLPPWLEFSAESFSGRVTKLPAREEILLPVQEQLIVELYSK
jgi:small subunit ribosomal protein S4